MQNNSILETPMLQTWKIETILQQILCYILYLERKNTPLQQMIPTTAYLTTKQMYVQMHSIVQQWNNTINGAHFSDEAISIIQELYRHIDNMVVQSGMTIPVKPISSYTIPGFKDAFLSKQIKEIPLLTYNQTANDACCVMASYSYDKPGLISRLLDMSFDEDSEDEAEEAERKLNEMEIYNLPIYALQIIILRAFCNAAYKNRQNIDSRQRRALLTYVQRITEFPEKLKANDKFLPEIISQLPVIPLIQPENIISRTSSFITFNVRMKFNKQMTPHDSQCNKPTQTLSEYLRQTDTSTPGYVLNKKKQLYCLLYYITYGKMPQAYENGQTEQLITDMKTAKTVTTQAASNSANAIIAEDFYNDVANVISILQPDVYETTVKFVPTEALPDEFEQKNIEQILKLDFSNQAVNGIDGHFKVWNTHYGTASTVNGGTIATKKESLAAEIALLQDRKFNFPMQHDFNQMIGDDESERIQILSGIVPPQNLNPYVYHITENILTTMVTYSLIQHAQIQPEVLMIWHLTPAMEQKGIRDDTEINDGRFVTVLAHALEQSLFDLTANAQGYVTSNWLRNGQTVQNFRYAKKNACSSMLSEFPKHISSHLPNTGVIFITSRKADKAKEGGNTCILLRSVEIYEQTMKFMHGCDFVLDTKPGRATEAFEFCQYPEESRFKQMINIMQSHGIRQIILMMTPPFNICPDTQIAGFGKNNITRLEEQYPNITFIPIYASPFQIIDHITQKRIINIDKPDEQDAASHLIIDNPIPYKEDSMSQLPLFACIVGGTFGNGHGYYKNGTMYSAFREYYTGKTGQAVEDLFIDYNKRIILETVMLLIHEVQNEKQDLTNNGRSQIFDKVRNEISSESTLFYQRDNSNWMLQINQLALTAKIIDIVEGIAHA